MLKYTLAVLMALVAVPSAATAQAVAMDTFKIGQSAASIEKARSDRAAGLRNEIERARQDGTLRGSLDPYFSTGISQTNTAGGYDFTVAGVRVLATCKAKGMRIYAIVQKREFRGVTVADVAPALKQKYGPARTIGVKQRQGMTNIEQWMLWDGVPQGLDGDMVEKWATGSLTAPDATTLPAGLSAHVEGALARVEVTLARYSPEIAADAVACAGAARAASRQRAVDAIKF